MNGLKLRSMLGLILGGVLEASWSDLGRFLGGQDAPKTAQDGAKTGQGGAKTPENRAKMLQDGAETVQERQITKNTEKPNHTAR